MGVLNCTPDSFSDGGRFFNLEDALRQGERLRDEGASIIDVGGESTRPGAPDVSADEQRQRVLPVITELRRRFPDIVLSIDTSSAAVAAEALAAGADVVNDVTAASDSKMLDLVARRGAAIVLMHMRGKPQTMQQETSYQHVVAEVHAFLRTRAAAATAAGIPSDRVWLDPGIGFGKNDLGNLTLLAALADLALLGHPVLIGPSRKSFIGHLTGAPVADRLPGTLAALIPALDLPRVVLRVHDPAAVLQFVEIAARVKEASA